MKKRNEQISSESGATGNMQIKEDDEEYEGEKKEIAAKTVNEVAVEDVDKGIKEQVGEASAEEDFTEVQVEETAANDEL